MSKKFNSRRSINLHAVGLAVVIAVIPIVPVAVQTNAADDLSLEISGFEFALPAPGSAVQAQRLMTGDELTLLRTVDLVRGGELDAALNTIEPLVARNPKFRLAQLVYADILLAKTRPLVGIGVHSGAATERLAPLLEEVVQRYRHRQAVPGASAVPEVLLGLSPRQKQAIVVDVAASRLYVFSNEAGHPRLVSNLFVSTGKNGASKQREGDQRTPLGVYYITGRIDSEQLPDFYGLGAFPVNYPNEWDLRLGRTGYGIWIHGVPSDTYNRAPRASDGCMALSNADLGGLWREVDNETPVIIAENLRWSNTLQIRARSDELRSRLESWRRAWESRDSLRYAAHYSRRFHSEDLDYRQWLDRKRRINARKSFIEIDIEDLSLFGYPGEDTLVTVTFDQDYRSSNLNNRSRKRQYWRLESDGAWRIVYEGQVRLRPEQLRGIPYSARSGIAETAIQ